MSAMTTPVASLPLQRQTVMTITLSALRERILRGVYAEGEPLRQDALALDFGVSRIPVREALRQLESEGLVTFNPHRGAIVSTLSLDEIDEVFSIRADLEGDLLRRAIPNMLPMHIDRALEACEAFGHATRQGDASLWGELNWRIHSTLYAPAARPVTMGIVQRLHHQCERYIRMQLTLADGMATADEEHRAIIAAARQKDVTTAVSSLRAHIGGAGNALLDFLRGRRAPHVGAVE